MMHNFQSDLEAGRVSGGLRTIAVGIVNYEKSLLELYDVALRKMQKYNTDIPNDSGDEK